MFDCSIGNDATVLVGLSSFQVWDLTIKITLGKLIDNITILLDELLR